jgi:hypothetical protein
MVLSWVDVAQRLKSPAENNTELSASSFRQSAVFELLRRTR